VKMNAVISTAIKRRILFPCSRMVRTSLLPCRRRDAQGTERQPT